MTVGMKSWKKTSKGDLNPDTYEKHYMTIQNLMAKRNDYPK